ncbi:MAG: HDOD domain-containing protein [Planctomycetales bacterium]
MNYVCTEKMAIDWTKFRLDSLGNYDSKQLPPKLSIPMMPHALMAFIKKSEDPDADAAELGKIIEADAGLTVELLKHLNSSSMALRQKVASCQRAIAVLGFQRCKSFLLAAALKRALVNSKKSALDQQLFSRSNLERAYFAQQVAKIFEADEELAFSAAVLSDCVLPCLMAEYPGEYATYLSMPPKGKPVLTEFEQKALGWDHARSMGMIMLGWNFPDDLICCVLHHHSAYQLLSRDDLRASEATAVAVASLIPDQLQQMPLGPAILMKLHTIVPQFELQRITAEVDARIAADLPAAASALPPLHDRIEASVKMLA